MGFHCIDCIYGSFSLNEKTKMYQGSCSRGYTLCNPHVHGAPQDRFAPRPEGLVPTVDPFGAEYLRTSFICGEFRRPADPDEGASA